MLAIIGLLVGSILVGSDLILAAQLRSIISEVEKYQSAVHTFKTKYNALPGDMADATQIWGQDSNCPDSGPQTAVPAAPTCDGNGDEVVTAAAPTQPQLNEAFRFWQQLGNAGLVQGAFTGHHDPATSDIYGAAPGINIPSIPIRGGGISLWYGYWPQSVGQAAGFNVVYPGYLPPQFANQHFFLIGAYVGGQTNYAQVFTPNEARMIDQKADDGLPNSGRIAGTQHNYCLDNNGNYKNADNFGADSLGTDPVGQCNLYWIAGF